VGVILEGMALENKGLTQIRTYDVEKAVDTLENVLGSTVGVLGGIATFLYAADIPRNENTLGGLGMNFQPSWTPGYEVNHDGVFQLAEFAFLGGYIAATYLGVKAAKKIAGPIARKWKAWKHESSGEKVRDEEFNANYQTLADKLLSAEPVPEKLHPDYKDSLHLDILTHYLSHNSAEGAAIARNLSQRRAGLVTSVVKEHMMKLDYDSATVSPYMQFLGVQDLLDLGNHYVESGNLKQAESFIGKHLNIIKSGENSVMVQSKILCMREKLAEGFYKAGQLTEAERIWKFIGNKEKLKTLPAAYRNAGDDASAARVFVEHFQ